MGPRITPNKNKSSSKKAKKGPVDNVSLEPNANSSPSPVASEVGSTATKAKKTSNRSLIKNSGVSNNNDASNADRSAPWFSSLVKDVASVLGKSPVKRKNVRVLGKDDESFAKKSKSPENPESESDSDYYVDIEDDDYYKADEEDPDCITNVQPTNDKSPSFVGSQKDEFIDFMGSFVESYKTQSTSSDVSHRKSVRFSPEFNFGASTSSNAVGPLAFGCPAVQPKPKQGTKVRSSSYDPSLMNSLRSDNNANNLAETFLQLAGLSQNDTSDLFKKVNARKSGEHRKA